MSFNVKTFERAKFEPRKGEIPLPALAPFFGEGESPVFVVRGLTAEELSRADEAARSDKLLGDLVEKLLTAQGRGKAAALLEGVGISSEVPAALRKRIEHVRLGLVEPALEIQHIVKLGEAYPIEFNQLANKILELTGQGQVARVKPRPSGASQK